MPSSALPTPVSAVPSRIDPDNETTKRSAAELRALLDARQNDLQFRIQAIKDELTNPSSLNVGGRPLPDVLRENALRNVGIALGAGATIGLLAGALSRRRHRVDPDEGFDLVRARLSTFLDDAAEHVRRGASSADAIRKTLRDTPVVYAPPAEQAAHQAKSSIREAVDTAVKSAIGFALKAAMDQLTKKLTGREETFAAVADAPDRP